MALHCLKKEIEQMFYGRFTHSIDKKGRMTVPSAYRELAPEGVVVTRGIDQCIMGLTKEAFQNLVDSISSLSLTDPTMRAFGRQIISNSASLEYDSAGRILVPLHLRKLVGIEENVIFVGVGDNFEIWSTEKFEAYEASIDPEEQAKAFASLYVTTKRGN